MLFCFSTLSLADSLRLSEPIAKDENSETFGAVFDSSLPTLSLAALDSSPQSYLGKAFTLEANIAKVCQKKGCFFIVQAENRIFRVAFRDYGFFIPTDSGGKDVVLNAELIKKELSLEQASHFKSDLGGKSEGLEAGIVYEIIADSIQIPIA